MQESVVSSWISFTLFVTATLISSTKGMTEPQDCDGCTRLRCESHILERLIRLEMDSEKLNKQLAKLEDKLEDVPVVMVKARLLKEIPVVDGEKVKYDLVLRNDMGSYKPQEGVFVAPISGVYLVTVTICLEAGQWYESHIIVNGGVVSQFMNGDDGFRNCNNEVVTQSLGRGDRLWVAKSRGSAVKFFEGHGWNMISVTLIQSF